MMVTIIKGKVMMTMKTLMKDATEAMGIEVAVVKNIIIITVIHKIIIETTIIMIIPTIVRMGVIERITIITEMDL